MPDLSIVVVSFNTKDLTVNCIKSIIESTKGLSYEIIVVDNASHDGSAEAAKELGVKVIENRKNVGFGRGNNQGLRLIAGRYFLLLNSDTIIKTNVLGEMVTFLDKNPKVGVASCSLKNADGSIQGTGGYFPTLPRVLAWMTFLEDLPFGGALLMPYHPVHGQSPFHKIDEGLFAKAREADWVTGAFMLGRREVLGNVGYFDEEYKMYVEEVDWQFRIKKAGWEIWYLPRWNITHLGGASSTREFPLLSEYAGIKIFYKKNMPGWQLPIVRFLLKVGAVLRIIIFGLLGRKELARTYAKAFKMA